MESEKTLAGKAETITHINRVRHYISLMLAELEKRSLNHDKSKLESPEKEIFGEVSGELAKTKYGSPEYQALLDKLGPALDHHYANNRHHPQFWKDGISDMTLIDLVEMLCDWKAATERMNNGNIRKSIEHNTTRFNISPQLAKIMDNTVREMFRD
jgi:hypothetical protein